MSDRRTLTGLLPIRLPVHPASPLRNCLLSLTTLLLLATYAPAAAQSSRLPATLDSTWQAPAATEAAFPSSFGGTFPAALAGDEQEPAQDPAPTFKRAHGGRSRVPPQAHRVIEPMDVDGLALRELLYALSLRYDTLITAPDGLDRRVTVHLPAVPLGEALRLLSRHEDLALHSDEDGFYFLDPNEAPFARGEPSPGETSLNEGPHDGGSSPPFSRAPLPEESAPAYSPQAERGSGPSAGGLGGLPGAIQETIRTDDAGRPPPPITEQDHQAPTPTRPPHAPPTAPIPAGVSVAGGFVSVNVEDTSVADVLAQLAQQTGLSLVSQAGADTRVTARWSGVTVDEALRILLMGTNLTYHREGATLVVADRQLPGMLTSKLIELQHVPAGGLVEQLPDALRQNATHRLVQEQNALVVTAPADIVNATESYLQAIDKPTEQILLEVLVVEFETTGLRQLGVTFLGGLLPADAAVPQSEDGTPGWLSYLFGGGSDQRGGLDLLGDGETANDFLNFWSDLLGIRSIGVLPSDFYFRLQALEQAGRADIRSRPHIATLNGHTASISVGTSQYYILKSLAPVQTPGLYGQGEAEHFEYVQADVRLEITPWVTASGDVTASIRPSFTTPVGTFDPRIPPTLRNWTVDTNVRLQDGETFMIGGLIQEKEVVSENRIPILGSLPLIGRVFRNTDRRKLTSELVIFITPHILREDGDEMRGARSRLAPRGDTAVAPSGTTRSWQ